MDKNLIHILLSNNLTKKRFFTEVDGVLVFDKIGFGWAINNRQFLPDNYTRFKNKVGLVDENGELIATSGKVELVFPYKDCVLEGGQTKKEQNRKEIFYNETLAPDEIDRLLYPKVFTNAKKYTFNSIDSFDRLEKTKEISCKTVTKFEKTDNLIIKGNNLLALSCLLKQYEGDFKCIFADPPYFFYKPKDSDLFNYNSNFKMSTWLTFCKNRFEIAKKLLANDGIMVITMGVDGYAQFKLLLDEIFQVSEHPKNYIGTITWRKTDNQSNIGDYANVVDYILLYRKNESTKLYKLPLTEKAQKEYAYEDEKGKYRRSNILDLTRGRYYYTIKTPDGNTLNGPWMIDEKQYRTLLNNNGIHWPNEGNQIPYGKIYLKDAIANGQITSDFWDASYGTNQRGANEIKDLFENRVFAFPKPERLLMNILTLCTKENDLVLDFYAGTGTTLAVAQKMNRQYVGIEQLDYVDSIVIERMKKVLLGEQGGISEDVQWKGGGSFVYFELMALNQNFLDEIEKAKDSKSLENIYYHMKKSGFISCKVDPSNIDANISEFKELCLNDQKRFLMELLDKNLLYVNYCDIDDEEFNVSDVDKAFTRSFYGGHGNDVSI